MKKTHYYPNETATGWTTACGRDGRKVGGLIRFFFRVERRDGRCKICDKRFRKDSL